ncbi:MAG: putative Ntn-hydrolase superfamily protein [Hyphomicrobiaceae bacterium]|jgi:uncharacterized Ntn-hydrolase superfamily protein
MRPVATFSIVAWDPRRKEWGVAVQSKFFAVGAIVPWCEANAGAVATQSYANLTYGPRGLQLMRQGRSASETIELLVQDDPVASFRQVGVVDRNGIAAAYTGDDCFGWAGHIVGDGFTCQGNILVPGTLEAMVECFRAHRNTEGELADWLVAALSAGQAAGGDSRGRQAASVTVVREGSGYGGDNDRYIDLRVDDDPEPIEKLQRLLELHHLYFGKANPADLVPMENVVADLQEILVKAGHSQVEKSGVFDEATKNALIALVLIENLAERWSGDENQIDQKVVNFLKNKFQ